MRKLTLLALACALAATVVLVPAAKPAAAGVGTCDVQVSKLCWGLVEWWGFEDYSLDAQYGSSGNTPLYEGDHADMVAGTSRGGTFGNSVAFDGTTRYLYSPRSGSLAPYFTIAFWLKPGTFPGTYQVLLTNIIGNVGTTNVGNVGGVVLRITDSTHKPEMVIYKDEGDPATDFVTATGSTAMTAGTWYLLVFKVSAFGTYGKANACISTTASGAGSVGAFACTTIDYKPKTAHGDLIIGGNSALQSMLYADMDSLGIWSRAWSTDDLNYYWNSGNGKPYPFRYSD